MSRFIILLLLTPILADKDLILDLEDGSIEGFYKTSYNGRKFAAFEGIPYAAAPIQNNRFKDPQPPPKWSGILKANVVYTCIQFANDTVFGTEDCLYINVYVPREKINPKEKMDVVVHIHGGAFMMGSGHGFSGPSKIMDRDVVYVNFNYRLGPLGFLATEDDVFHGNYGMKDQSQALRWVQANIVKFGGNPDSVTIIGLSAGGASVHLHYFAWNTNETLFHRGWAQSGAAFNPWAIKISTWPNSKKLITALGCLDESIKVTLGCMKQRTALQITEAVKTIYHAPLLPLAPFAPHAELASPNNQNPFLIADPYIQLKSGDVMNKPFIISQTTDEGMLPAAFYYNKLEEVNKNWETLAPLMLEYYDAPEDKQREVSAKIKEFYFKGEDITTSNFKIFINVCSQRLFHMGAEKSVKMQANVSTENMYFMMFGYPGDDNPVKTFYGIDVEGVGHGFDAKFMYDFEELPGKLTPEEERMKDILLDFLVSFAKTGVPTSEGIEWTSVPKEGNLKYLLIKSPDETEMKSTERLGAYEFWKSLGLKEQENAYHFSAAGIEINN